MEYLTIASDVRVAIRGFTKQPDADKAKFSLLRRDSQKKILDSTSPKVRKTSALDPLVWELTIDADIIKAALTEDEMQCEMFVSITAGGKTWSPQGQEYVLYRNKVTLAVKDGENAALPRARCTYTIRPPDDYHPKSSVRSSGSAQAAPAGRVRPAPPPRAVITGADGTVELPLEAPGEIDLVWDYPHYPKDQAAWVAQKGEKRETVLLERERKAHFVWPDLSKGGEQKHYVNLGARPSSNRGGILTIVAGIDGAVPGDKIYLTVELAAEDTKDLAGKPLKCDVGGELEVGKPKKTLTLPLDAEDGTRTVMLDFNGWGGITAKLAVSTVEGSTDEKVEVTSWRKVGVQPYHPAPRFFGGDAFPEALADKVKAAFDPVFIEVEFLQSRLLADAFAGIEEHGKFSVVQVSGQHAQAAGLGAGSPTGGATLVFFKLGRNAATTPAHWIMRPSSSGSGERYAGVYRSDPRAMLHLALAHDYYEAREEAVSLTLSQDKLESDPQTTATLLCAHNIDANENAAGDLVLPWSTNVPSYWQVEGENTRGEVTMDFVDVDRDKAKQGICQFKLKLPEGAPGDPRALAALGKRINLYVKLRTYQFGVAGAGVHPVMYAGLPADYASARAAHTVIHELAHALGFAPKSGEFFYSLAGPHCACDMKSDAETYVRDNKGTVGQTVGATLTKGVTGRNVPLELVAQGKFGTCVMWGQTHRQKTTEDMFKAALKFCDTCAPLMRVTPVGDGGGA